MRRRSFLQGLFALPTLAAFWPRAVQARAAHQGLVYTDSIGTADLSALADGVLSFGIEYQP